jgi:hypothetical protein
MTPRTNRWQPFDTPCTSCRIVGFDGFDGERLLFAKQPADEVEIYASNPPLADSLANACKLLAEAAIRLLRRRIGFD